MSDEPVPVTAALDGLLRSMRGGAGRAEVGGVFGRWDDAVGPMIAAHVRPVRLEHGVLLVEVSEPAWSTQVRFLADVLRSQHHLACHLLRQVEEGEESTVRAAHRAVCFKERPVVLDQLPECRATQRRPGAS